MSKKEEYTKFILENYNNMTNKEISEHLGISVSYITEIKRKNNLPSKKIYSINEIQHQILISGKLGDGSYKKNGLHAFYYRETHSVAEEEYLLWKYNSLGELTKGNKINFSKRRNENQFDQKNFNTKTTKQLIEYANMSNSECIEQLNDLGLILYILDDGWRHIHRLGFESPYNICLAVHALSEEEKELLLDKFESELGVSGNIICKDRNTISFNKDCNDVFIGVLEKYGLRDLDVSIKKFNSR